MLNKMSETSVSNKINSIVALLHPNAMKSQILSASAQLSSLAKEIKALEDENSSLKAKIQEIESGR
ncbi:MAG: hypothetical protein IBX56_12115 [Methylomicrobium sp.]|nr:hypothetical protein [Methylomicrobium sp.]